MPVTIQVNGTVNTLVHKMSTGISTATIPDVCKTPSPGGPVPIPYPNIAQSITLASGTTNVKGDKMMASVKGSKFALSNGDNAGVAGGIKSSTFMKEATWILYSFDVKLQKKNAARLSDKMFHNSENAANLGGEVQGTAKAGTEFVEKVGKALADKLCDAACKAMAEKKELDAAAIKKGEMPTAKFQNLMRKHLDPKIAGTRGTRAKILTEVGQKITDGGGDFIGRYGKGVAGGAAFVKWDIVITVAKTTVKKTLDWKGVKNVIEVKFPGDTDTLNQIENNDSLGRAKKSKVVKMEPASDCKCSS
jgi:Domain of unknown function (DUF4150)